MENIEKMKTIAFLIMDMDNKGGTERVVSMIANALSNRYRVYIFSCRNGLHPHFHLNDSVVYESLHGENYSNLIQRRLSLTLKLINKVRQNHIDIVVAVDIALYLYLLPLKIKRLCKVIAWEHFMFYLTPKKTLKIARYLAGKTADCIVVLSKHDLQNYKDNLKNIKRIEYIYNPLAVNTKDDANMNNHTVITVGRLVPQKNQQSLINIWREVEDKFPEWNLEIWGEGENRELLNEQIKKLNLHNVKLCGYANNVSKVLKRASIFAFTSKYEGYGLALIEAQAKGLPCISFNCKEGPAEIIKDGKNGYLIPIGQEDVFAKKLGKLMQNKGLREKFSSNSKNDLYKYNIKETTKKWINLLESI